MAGTRTFDRRVSGGANNDGLVPPPISSYFVPFVRKQLGSRPGSLRYQTLCEHTLWGETPAQNFPTCQPPGFSIFLQGLTGGATSPDLFLVIFSPRSFSLYLEPISWSPFFTSQPLMLRNLSLFRPFFPTSPGVAPIRTTTALWLPPFWFMGHFWAPFDFQPGGRDL